MKTNDYSGYRSEFPITECCTFLSHAAVSPLNRRAAQAVQHYLDQVQTIPFMKLYQETQPIHKDLRARLATLINARTMDEIVIMPNTATGLSTAAASLPLQPGDNALVVDGDYPANIYPWMNLAYRGVLTKMVPQSNGGLDLNLLEQRIDNRTRVIALSTVMFATGFRNDIEAVGKLCKERGIFFVVDGIQSLGAFPLDVQACNIDFLAAGSHKWLLSAPGSGFLYCRQEMLERVVPGAYVGASSVVDPWNFLDYNLTFPPSAERFSIGSSNFLGITAFHATLSLLQEIGIENISSKISSLIELLITDLTNRGYHLSASTESKHRSGIVVVKIPDAEKVNKRFEEANIILTTRGTGLRIAPHFYNTVEEILSVGALLDHA